MGAHFAHMDARKENPNRMRLTGRDVGFVGFVGFAKFSAASKAVKVTVKK
jgi:hypothetical protein